jgi:carboxypeptidase T
MNLKLALASVAVTMIATLPLNQAHTNATDRYWMKIKAADKFQRSLIADTGVSIDRIVDDYVYATGSLEEKNAVEKLMTVETLFPMTTAMIDFPSEDSKYHNYDELVAALNQLHAQYPDITELFTLGTSAEGRAIPGLRISGNLARADQLPGMFFVGGHHAREHLSVDTPLRLAHKLLISYASGDATTKALVDNRDLHVVPGLNVDGLEHDVSGNRYKMWRKNRSRNHDGTYGVDLNRNYGFQWGTGGSSKSTSSDVYMGPAPFSEPESKAVKDYVENQHNLTILLSFHTFSKLILYPWGHKYDGIEVERDRRVHETMAQRMAQWNGYEPQQASDLYIASGDTTDWSYGTQKLISFTFELDPANMWGGGGFYPGDEIIDEVVAKNWNPFIYLLNYADNPYRVIDGGAANQIGGF